MPHNHWFLEKKKNYRLATFIVNNTQRVCAAKELSHYRIHNKFKRLSWYDEERENGGVGRRRGWLLFALTVIYNAIFIAYPTTTAERRVSTDTQNFRPMTNIYFGVYK